MAFKFMNVHTPRGGRHFSISRGNLGFRSPPSDGNVSCEVIVTVRRAHQQRLALPGGPHLTLPGKPSPRGCPGHGKGALRHFKCLERKGTFKT